MTILFWVIGIIAFFFLAMWYDTHVEINGWRSHAWRYKCVGRDYYHDMCWKGFRYRWYGILSYWRSVKSEHDWDWQFVSRSYYSDLPSYVECKKCRSSMPVRDFDSRVKGWAYEAMINWPREDEHGNKLNG